MPQNENERSAYASKVSSKKWSKDETSFDSEYRRLCDKLAKKGGRITESEERRIEKFEHLDKEDYLKREELFLQIKEQTIKMKQMEKSQKEMEECSFKPDTSVSKRPGEQEYQPRELYGFLSDQQRYMETKNLKIMRGQ